MGIGPKQMGEAILRNLKVKTGKNIDEWLTVVHSTGLSEKKNVMEFLKKEHGLGHFQAQHVFEKFANEDVYGNDEELVNNLFNTEPSKVIYTQVKEMISTLGEDVEIRPCKTYIPFYRRHQFAIVTLNKSEEVVLAVNLPDGFTHDRFTAAKTLASKRINFQTIIAKQSDLDNEIKSIVQQAYGSN